MNDKKSKRISMLLNAFYVVVIIFIIGSIYFFRHEKTGFYLYENDITIPLSSNYSIKPIAKDDVKGTLKYTYESTNENVAVVSKDGVVRAVGSGEAKIIVKTTKGDTTNELKVNVSEDDVYLIDFNPSELILNEKEEYTLKPTVNNEENYSLDMIWTSSDNSVVSVDSNGKIKAKKVGVSYITVSIKDTEYSSNIKITVLSDDKNKVANNTKKPDVKEEKVEKEEDDNEDGMNEVVNTHIYVSGVKLKTSKNKLKIGNELKLKYEVIPSNASNKKVSFSSNNESVISVDSNGKIKALKEGTADISIKTKEGKFTDYVTITVEKPIIKVSGIQISKTTTSIMEGETEKLSYSIIPDDADNKAVSWRSEDTSIADVDGTGLVSAKKEGTTSIMVRSDDGKYESTCIIIVTKRPVPVESVVLNKKSTTIKAGETEKLTYTLSPSDASNQNVKWTSSDTSIASVDSDGVVSAKNGGTAIITVTSADGSRSDSCTVTVKEILVTELSLNKSNFQMSVGTTVKIGCSIKPSDATDKTIKWTSSNKSVATVDSNGNVTGTGYGMVKITAKNAKSGKSISVKIYVVPTDKMINIKNSKYKAWKHNIETVEGGSLIHMQSFEIVNIGKDNQVIYLSTAQNGCYSVSKNPVLSQDKKDNLVRTIIYKITKSDISNSNRTNKMYLEHTGHGQAFAVEPDSDVIWTNADHFFSQGGGYYWGQHKGIMRIKFKKNSKNSSFSPLVKFRVKDNNDKEYYHPEPAIDEKNNLILIKSDKNMLIYDYKEFKKGNQVLLYKCTLSRKVADKYSDGTSNYNQGITIKGGYIYQFRGAPEKDTYIEVFNLLGQSQYVKKLNADSSFSLSNHREAEGLKIYNNRIYVGTTKFKNGVKNAYVFDIGYYE